MALVAAYAEARAADAGDPVTLPTAPELATAISSARAAWPELARTTPEDDLAFARHLGRHDAGRSAGSPLGELYLAWACAVGDARAIALLDERYIAGIGKAIWQVGIGDRDDVLQRVRELLLVSDAPMIATYGGRGSLRGWIRSIVLRTAMKQARGIRPVSLDEHDFLELAASADEPELEPFKQRYRDEFRAAFRTAVAALSVRHRNILRQYFLDRMTVDELGVLYRVHRATAARWVHEVRAELIAGVRAALATSIGGDIGLGSMIDLVASQLELSLERLTAE